MNKAIISLAMLLISTSTNAQTFSMTPRLDAIEMSTGIKVKPELSLSPVQYDYEWDNEAPFLVSLGVLAICVTVIVLATTSAESGHASSSEPLGMDLHK